MESGYIRHRRGAKYKRPLRGTGPGRTGDVAAVGAGHGRHDGGGAGGDMNVAAGRERLAVGHGAGAGGAALPHGGRKRLVGVLV